MEPCSSRGVESVRLRSWESPGSRSTHWVCTHDVEAPVASLAGGTTFKDTK